MMHVCGAFANVRAWLRARAHVRNRSRSCTRACFACYAGPCVCMRAWGGRRAGEMFGWQVYA
eukprot:6156836-Pleurochrysis_carterae.AAC.2